MPTAVALSVRADLRSLLAGTSTSLQYVSYPFSIYLLALPQLARDHCYAAKQSRQLLEPSVFGFTKAFVPGLLFWTEEDRAGMDSGSELRILILFLQRVRQTFLDIFLSTLLAHAYTGG
jgi:hypothetical protein